MPKVKIEVSGVDEQTGHPGLGTNKKGEKWRREIATVETFTEARVCADAMAKVRPSNHTIEVQMQDKQGNWVTRYETEGKGEKQVGVPVKPGDPNKPKKEKAAKAERKSKLRAV